MSTGDFNHMSLARLRRRSKLTNVANGVCEQLGMGIENFIADALHKPNDYLAYHVGRELAELHPGKTILEGETGYFDLEAFVRAEKCSLVHEGSIFNHIKTYWDGPARS